MLACLTVPVLLAACASSREEGAGSRLERETGGADYSFAAGGKIALPDPFPEDLPLYPEASLLMSQRLDVKDATVILRTSSAPEEVVSFYRREMEERGWRFMGDATVGAKSFQGFEHERAAASVVVTPGEGETVDSLSYTAKPGG